jgi:glycosyltransferase involved in cell wall biosynthesis
MNICLVTSTFPANPQDRLHGAFLLDAVSCLQRAGHDVSVLTQQRTDHHAPPVAGMDVVWFPWRRLHGRLAELSFGSPGAVLAALSLVWNGTRAAARRRRDRKIDVFLCAWIVPSGLYLCLDQLFGGSRVPYVLWALGSDVNKYKSNPIFREVLKRVVRRAAHVYADGYELCEGLASIAGRPCEFLPTFRSIPLRRSEIPEGPHSPRFLFVGRHARVKGLDVLVEAALALRHERAFFVDVVGDGELTGALRARVASAGMDGIVRFHGQLDDAALHALYAACDCVVIPSRSESIPIVLSEALQARKPLIVTDVGDMGRIVRENHLGEVVPSEDPRLLAGSLRSFIDRPWSASEEGRARVVEELMFESAAPRLLRKLEEVVRT